MPEVFTSSLRPSVSGKFFRVGEKKFYLKGVTYGPFAPNAEGDAFPTHKQTARDFTLIRKLGANVLRIYQVPPRWFLDLAAEHDLKLLIDICWDKHTCFLDSPERCDRAKNAVRRAVQSCAKHPAVFAYSVVNEIPADVVRWSGADRIEKFIDELIAVAKDVDPECLCTFGNYPPTEFLAPHSIDFFCFNVYLHNQRPFENYVARLQMIANEKPLVLGELGIDTIREGEAQKCEMLDWMIETTFRGGAAGAVVFSFTDEWFKDGREILEWGFGLTTRERQPKDSFAVVQKKFETAPFFPLPRTPKVSIVVACFNGGRTLQACLDSLLLLNYPDYEVILIDDGSTDITPQVASLYKKVRYCRLSHHGLSVARNAGIELAEGEVVAFTDADCRADEDWLYYLVSDLLKGSFVAVGGHNFLPPDDSPLAAAVMVAPGGPAHVMLTDRVAEHIPGCNMAFYKWSLEEIAGFDPIFEKAGDDVDVCWRLQQRGYKIGFSPGGFVWHYRRSTVGAYLRQQRGYGEAEALLVRRHPEYFNSFGSSMWQGKIYSSAASGVTLRRPMIYHGSFGTGFFQSVYRAAPAFALMLCTTLEYHALVTLPLLVLSVPFHYLIPLAVTSVAVSIVVCIAAAVQAELPANKYRFWSRPVIALMFFLQPILRGWARYQGRLAIGPTPQSAMRGLSSRDMKDQPDEFRNVNFWGDVTVDRLDFVRRIIARLEEQGWQLKVDAGWSNFDLEILGSRWAHLQLTTVSEPQGDGKQLLRSRLLTAWSLFAKVILGAITAFDLLVIGFVGTEIWWLWSLLLTIPAFAWFVRNEQRDLRKLIAVIINDVARQNGLTKVNLDKPKEKSVPEHN
ncbi:MAG: glycosyltransferase [Limisphaerales bacterium]